MIGKILGGGLGWMVGGPIGALVGVAIGSAFDSSKIEVNAKYNPGRKGSTRSEFHFSLLVLSAAMMKADGKVLKSELSYVKEFFTKSFGDEIAQEQILLLRNLLKENLDVPAICRQINRNMRIAEKRLVIQYLFGIAQADGELHAKETRLLKTICSQIGLVVAEYNRIAAMYGASSQSYSNSRNNRTRSARPTSIDYDILGVKPTDSMDVIKKAYRKLAIKHHPDKVAHLGDEHAKLANEKFQKIQKAYDNIEKSRK